LLKKKHFKFVVVFLLKILFTKKLSHLIGQDETVVSTHWTPKSVHYFRFKTQSKDGVTIPEQQEEQQEKYSSIRRSDISRLHIFMDSTISLCILFQVQCSRLIFHNLHNSCFRNNTVKHYINISNKYYLRPLGEQKVDTWIHDYIRKP